MRDVQEIGAGQEGEDEEDDLPRWDLEGGLRRRKEGIGGGE